MHLLCTFDTPPVHTRFAHQAAVNSEVCAKC